MRFSIVLGQRLPWAQMLANARETETLGFDGLFLVDHFFGRLDVHEPTHEGYTMLAALAPFTSRLRLGLMVAGNTYRNPTFLLKQAITVDHISGGRVDFGVGAGWAEREHEAFGYDFPTPKVRVDMFAEALEIWNLVQQQEHTSFDGKYYQIVDAPFEPKSLQGRLPFLIGGSRPRMLRLTARYADLWNCTVSPTVGQDLNRQLDEACRAEGRDPLTIERTVSPEMNLLESVSAFADGVEAYRKAGFSHITMPWPRNETEVPILRAAAREVMSNYRSGSTTRANTEQGGSRRALIGEDRDLVARLTSHAAWPALAYLIERPDQLVDGNEMRATLGVDDHASVSRAFAELAAIVETEGVSRPWQEGPRGRTISSAAAKLLGQ